MYVGPAGDRTVPAAGARWAVGGAVRPTWGEQGTDEQEWMTEQHHHHREGFETIPRAR